MSGELHDRFSTIVKLADTISEQVADPMARMNFAASTALCTPGALSQHGPRALGNQVIRAVREAARARQK